MRRRFKIAQLAVQSQKSILCQLFGILAAPGQSQAQTEDPGLVLANQPYEGVRVAGARRSEVPIGFRARLRLGLQGGQLQR
jgi:hypothetical protein